MITPEMLARSGTEHGEQCALFCWAALPEQRKRFPELEWMHAIPNAGARGNKVAAAQLKAEGVKAGVSDILLPVQRTIMYCPIVGMYVELKRANGVPSDFSKQQLDFARFVLAQKYAWVPAFGWREAAHAIEGYLLGVRYSATPNQLKVIQSLHAQ